MLRGAPPAAGPTGTVCRARATPCSCTALYEAAPSAVDPTGTIGRGVGVDGPRRLRVDACASRHRRPRDHSWDRGLYAGRRSCSSRSGSYASTHAHLGTAGRETILGIAGRKRAGGAARLGAGSYASSHAHLGTAGRETILGIAGCERAGRAARLGVDLHVYTCPPWHCRPRDPQGGRGLRAGRRSCVTRNGYTDVDVTQ